MFIFSPIKKRAFSPNFAPVVLAVLAALALGAATACASPPADGGEGETMTFIGHITDVRARSLIELESLRVTGADGASLRFHAEEGRGFDEFGPSHAREHMLTGEPVEVTYIEEDGRLLIVDLADAPSGGETPAPF